MKHILLPALLFVANMAFAQFNPSPVSVNPLKTPDYLLVKSDYDKAQSRNNEELRLDSVVSFKNYLGLDSLRFQTSIRTYQGDTTTITFSNLNDFSGEWQNGVRYRVSFDMADRNDFFDYSSPVNGDYQVQARQKTFYRFAEGEEKDSILNYFRDQNSGLLYKDSRLSNYIYNAINQETQYDQFNYSVAGEQINIARYRSVYDIENRLDSFYYMAGLDISSLQTFKVLSYTHSNDTTVYVSWEKQPNGTWIPNERFTTVSNHLGSIVFIHSETFETATQLWKTNYKTERIYDLLNRLIILKSTTYGITGVENTVITNYGYINENQTKHAFIYDVDNTSGNLILRYKDYYYYTEISGTDGKLPKVDNVTIFPNPANDMITVDAKNSGVSRVEIYNLSGQLILSQSSLTGSPVINIRREGLSAGAYLVKVITNEGAAVREVVFK